MLRNAREKCQQLLLAFQSYTYINTQVCWVTQSYKASKTEQSQTHLSQKRLPDPTDCVLCANWASTKHTAHNCFMKAPDNIIMNVNNKHGQC